MQHKQLFVLSEPYSGSTVLTALLGTSPNVSILDSPEHEGLKLPGIKGMYERIVDFKNYPMPWGYLDQVYRKHWDLSRPVLVEKGHYLRNAWAIQDFYPDAHFILLVRNPYAWCESIRRRHQETTPAPAHMNMARRWLWTGSWQIHNLRSLKHAVVVTYEELCDRPDETLQKLYAFLPELAPLDANREFLVHSMLGKDSNPLTNTNAQAIARLSPHDIRDITEALRGYPEITDYFGCQLIEAPSEMEDDAFRKQAHG